MPFATGARIEIENQSGRLIDNFYYNIDYTEMEKLSENTGRFHAWFNCELTETLPEGENEWSLLGAQGKNLDGKDNYLFADIKGKGHFVDVNYYVNNPSTMWYGEGDEMIFIDGEPQPRMIGTGTEDFFNTSWCYELRQLTKLTAKYNVATQMGNQGNSHDDVRKLCEWILNNEIGEIKDIHACCMTADSFS